MSMAWYLILAGVIFSIGAVVVLVRRSAVISLMGVELMLNSANLALVTFA
ncbi:MAG: NADH-quinone oxidoreductase subunit K, partial [Actinomyces sp.]|nr:NADH-quinone oxidoreductase subunit K [Actinomyces sp.]